ncbi:MAG: ribosome biogenesis GTPase YlqF [Candidatus Eremiobacteraeota bacterium]|nr:ribosome biogenesis GTPase YlqF [Candidatus Eremiobacteraeota bacterium]
MTAELERVVQWYPGHMVRAMRKIGEYLKLIDVVIEVADARVPRSGRNPALDTMIAGRAHIVVLTRQDLADPHATKAWIAEFAARDLHAMSVDARSQQSVTRVAAVTGRVAKTRGTSRAIVVGLPNSGKSSIINGIVRRNAAKTENRAGVTRQLQWFRLSPHVELMDTPGVLVPKIATKAAQWKLAICGALPRERYDPEQIVAAFHRWLTRQQPQARVPDLENFAAARGFVRRGGSIDYHNAAQSYIRALNDGAFGRMSFEFAGDDAQAA